MTGKKTSIKRKMLTTIMGTSLAVLVLTCAVFIVYEYVTFRKTMVQRLTLRADIIAANVSAALAFQNEADATEILSLLKIDPHMVGACLYDKDGQIFAKFPANAPAGIFPTVPEKKAHQFDETAVAVFEPVVMNGRWLGTLYLKIVKTDELVA